MSFDQRSQMLAAKELDHASQRDCSGYTESLRHFSLTLFNFSVALGRRLMTSLWLRVGRLLELDMSAAFKTVRINRIENENCADSAAEIDNSIQASAFYSLPLN